MEAYFDNAATTKCSDAAKALMARVLCEDYGNPSSLHRKGMEGEAHLREAAARISKTLKSKPSEIVFTSGGTEANNLAIIGAALANRRSGMHLVTTQVEHPAVANPMKFLEEQGFSVTYLEVDRDGRISLEELEESLTPETILVSIMYVNNEIGAVEPIAEAGQIIKQRNPGVLFHVDAIQAYGKYKIYPQKLGIDFLSVSGHKIHGPKGIGLLYGGGQQKGLRSGTENVPGIAALGQAAMEAYEDLAHKQEHLYQLKEAFVHGLAEEPWAHFNGRTGRDGAPHILSLSIDHKPAPSATLRAIQIPKEHLGSTIRISFCAENTLEEVEYCLSALKDIVPMLRKFTRH